MTYLDDRAVYEERYDKLTVELCRDREEMVHRLLGERPPLDSRGEADAASGYYQYSIMYFHLVEALAGERWQEREETINKWMADDEAKDRRLADAKPAVIPYCRSCGGDMQITLKSYHRREHGKTQANDQDILFMFDCKSCKKRVASWQDGTEWKPPQACCEQCGEPVEETDKLRGKVLTTTYTCANCGHHHKGTMRFGETSKTDPDPHFKLDRRRFCFDAATGQKFRERKAHMEHLRDVMEKASGGAGGSGQTVDPLTETVEAIQKLKVAQVADLLAKAIAGDGYTEFKLGELQVGPELAVPFNCLDNQPERGDYDSRTRLKKLITAALADTNWQLMSEGVSHRLGYLSGRLRAYESEEELRKLAEKQIKAGTRKKPVAKSTPPSQPAAPTEPPPTPKRSRRGKQRAIRARGVLHHDLHILIPPREATKPSPKTKGKRK
jgi:predicted RNA-binding Zn-ribbon protein involved in translation (DUF1610 family)